MKQDVEERHNDAMQRISKDDTFREIKMAELNNRRNESLEAAEAFDKKVKKQKRKKITDYWKVTEELMQDNKTKSVIELDSGSSIKSVAIQTNPNVKITTRFMKGKMLMFAKISIISFVYDMINLFCFPEDNPKVQLIYDKHKMEKCFLYQNVTDTDSTSLFFVFIYNLNCQLNEKDSRNVVFEVMINSKMFERLDLSNEFWSQLNVRDKSSEKQVGMYEIENIDNLNMVTIAVNPKEYFEKYRDQSFNKKHKGLKKDTPVMHFEAYANRVM